MDHKPVSQSDVEINMEQEEFSCPEIGMITFSDHNVPLPKNVIEVVDGQHAPNSVHWQAVPMHASLLSIIEENCDVQIKQEPVNLDFEQVNALAEQWNEEDETVEGTCLSVS